MSKIVVRRRVFDGLRYCAHGVPHGHYNDFVYGLWPLLRINILLFYGYWSSMVPDAQLQAEGR